jgi:hypothetical protein
MVVSAFSITKMILLTNKNWGIGETEVLDPQNGDICDDGDF